MTINKMNPQFDPKEQLFNQIYTTTGEDGYDLKSDQLEDLITLVIQKGLLDSSEDASYLKPVSLKSYIDFLKEKNNSESLMISESIIESYLEEILESSKLKIYFPENYRVFIVPIPFSNTSNSLNKDQIQRGEALKILITKDLPGAKVEIGEFLNSHITSVIPDKIHNISFLVPKYENQNILDTSSQDRQVIKDLLLKAIKDLQDLLNS